MKSLLGLAALVFSFNSIAYVGKFVEPVQTFVMGYETEADCQGDNGDWDSEMELCFFPIENEVFVTETTDSYALEITTWGANAHSCMFEGDVTRVLPNALISEVPVEIWVNDAWVPAICEVTLNYSDSQTVEVSTNGNCYEFCGMRASLEMGPATLVE